MIYQLLNKFLHNIKYILDLKKKRKEKEALLKDIKEQIRTQEEILRKHKEEDEEISKVYQEYNAIEIEKEKAARLAKIEQTRKEWATFKKYLQEVELHKKNEEKKLNELMTIFRKEIQKKHEEAECKIAAARMELHKVSLFYNYFSRYNPTVMQKLFFPFLIPNKT